LIKSSWGLSRVRVVVFASFLFSSVHRLPLPLLFFSIFVTSGRSVIVLPQPVCLRSFAGKKKTAKGGGDEKALLDFRDSTAARFADEGGKEVGRGSRRPSEVDGAALTGRLLSELDDADGESRLFGLDDQLGAVVGGDRLTIAKRKR
jgi:hypothetical protein